MPQLDAVTFPSQIFWLVVSFAVLYWLMSSVALPRIEKIIEERRNRVDNDLAKAAQMKSEAEAVIAAYEKALAEARAAAQATVRQTTERMNAESAERQRVAGARLAEQAKAAEQRILHARDASLVNIRAVAVEVARAAAERLTGASVDEGRAGAAVDAVMRERA